MDITDDLLVRFITDRCTLGTCPTSSKPYQTLGKFLYEEFVTYPLMADFQLPTMQCLYSRLETILRPYGITRRSTGRGIMFTGIILTKNVATEQAKPVRNNHRTLEEQRAKEREYKREYRRREKETKMHQRQISTSIIPVNRPNLTITKQHTQPPPPQYQWDPTEAPMPTRIIPPPQYALTPPKVEPQKVTLRIVRPSNPFVWDGSYLGRLDETQFGVYHIVEGSKKVYYKLTCKGYETVVLRTRCNSSTPNIVDELKGFFGLHKLHTHSCTLSDGHRYLLVKARFDRNGSISAGLPLSSCDLSTMGEKFLSCVRDIFLFRELLGISTTNLGSIIVDVDGMGNVIPISRKESTILDDKSFTLDSVMHDWFPDVGLGCPITAAATRFLNIKTRDDITIRVADIRTEVEKIVKRIDKDAITLSTIIGNRVFYRLDRS